ncbi:hypothetical protein BAY59_24200 [Prauserella coralliicola]|nr:hypothetical protein BAY59_24200 [Prauserella coralliicola]
MRRPRRIFRPEPPHLPHGRHDLPDGERNFPAPEQRPHAVYGHTTHATAYIASTTKPATINSAASTSVSYLLGVG